MHKGDTGRTPTRRHNEFFFFYLSYFELGFLIFIIKRDISETPMKVILNKMNYPNKIP